MDLAECALSHIAMRTRLPFCRDAQSLHFLAAPLARLKRLKLYPAGEPDVDLTRVSAFSHSAHGTHRR